MASLPAQLILPLLLLLGSCSANLIRGGHVLKQQEEFDYFTLALYWSGTSCLSNTECCPTNPCCGSSDDVATGFTIEGFWPDYNNGTWPSCCDGPIFNPSEILDLMIPLKRYWPNYSCVSSNACGNLQGSYLAYEWEKHGTCASSVFTNQHEYFDTALRLYLILDVTRILNTAGFTPSSSAKYPLKGITSAIQKDLMVTPKVTCNGDALKGVQICFNKMLQLQDCPLTSSDCPSQVSLPTIGEALTLKSNNYLSFRGE